MVRSASIFALLGAFLPVLPVAAAEPTIAQYRQLFDQRADHDIFSRVGGSPQCRQAGCQAVENIAEAFDAMWIRNIPNTMARTTPGPTWEEAGRIATREINRSVLRHTGRHAAYCAILAAMAGHFQDYVIGFNAIELSARLTRSGQDCLGPVIDALPRNVETDSLIRSARDHCETYTLPACDRIARADLTPPSATPPAPAPPPAR